MDPSWSQMNSVHAFILSVLRTILMLSLCHVCGLGNSVGIVTDYRLDSPRSNLSGTRFCACLDWLWGPPSLLYNGYWVFPRGKVQPWHAADHSPPSSAAVMEE